MIGKLKPDFTGFVPFEDKTLFKEITPENYVEGPLNGGDVELNLSNLYVSILMHCHYKTSLLSVFSLSDIYRKIKFEG